MTIRGRTYVVDKADAERVVLVLPPAPTQSIGAFIVPADAKASSSQEAAGRLPRKLIDGSGWGETFPGSGVYVHSNNVYADGGCMWNGAADAWLIFDLGKEYLVSGIYVWNYNERDGWNTRSVREADLSASADGTAFRPVDRLRLSLAPGTEDYPGEALRFRAPVRARYFRLQILSNYRGGEMSGLSEVRFADAERAAPPPAAVEWKPKYPRPEHPRLALGAPLPGAENVVFPDDAGIVDVTKPPYRAKGDGVADDTEAIQRALADHPNRGAIIYLPNGIYLVSDTIRWPSGGNPGSEAKRTVFQGQSRRGTVVRLRDDCPGFEDPRRPKAPIWTGRAPAQRFGNEIHNLTVDTGAGNPGACGIQFIANNQGGIYDVTILSGDGRGVVGLDMGYTDEQGPCLVKNVEVVGFDVGVRVATSVASETLEHIVLRHQNRFGLRNDGQPCTIRDLRSANEVPALCNTGGFTVLVDSVLEGTGAAACVPAVASESAIVVRNLRTKGYRVAIEHRAEDGAREVTGPDVETFLSKPAVALFGDPAGALGLPVRETPELPWDPVEEWVSPRRFGASPGDGAADAEAIQKAIDSGATTVYLPRGEHRIDRTVSIRGKVRRLLGCKAVLVPAGPLRGEAKPLLSFEDGEAPVVSVEWIDTDFSGGPYWFLEHASKRALVLRRLGINFQAAEAYRNSGTGDLYIEDVVGRWFRFRGQSVWARQFNVEGDGTHVLNDGGSVWILGLKTEGGGTLLETRNGGRTELLGSFSYTVGRIDASPMFVVDEAEASIAFAEVCYTGRPFERIVRETRGGVTREILRGDLRWGGH
ncbi:MAG: glycosyl hydrolase family 28-related protein, partial [Planctomycetota bacterium]